MGDVMAGLIRLVIQAVLLVAGLVVAASLLVAGLLLASIFGLRLLWARLTGRPVVAFGVGMDPAAGWRRYRAWQARGTTKPTAHGARPGVRLPPQDVEDVEPKESPRR